MLLILSSETVHHEYAHNAVCCISWKARFSFGGEVWETWPPLNFAPADVGTTYCTIFANSWATFPFCETIDSWPHYWKCLQNSAENNTLLKPIEKTKQDQTTLSFGIFFQVLIRMQQYKDDLLASCLRLVLSLPLEVVILDVASLVPALKVHNSSKDTCAKIVNGGDYDAKKNIEQWKNSKWAGNETC